MPGRAAPTRRSSLRVVGSIVELIGDTPMIRLNNVCKGLRPHIYAKLELLNPGGSVKDRIGLAMILDAERRGLIRPGCTIVEPTSGNTGTGLAMAAIQRGYKMVFVVPDKMSQDKIDLLRALGAKVKVTPTRVPPGHPAGYIEVAKRIVEETPNAFMPNQYENQANPEAHYATTGPEIWVQTDGRVDVLVAGVGTGGTITGTARYLKEMKPSVVVVGVDPEGSLLASRFERRRGQARPYKVEGIGEDFLPKTLDMGVIDKFVTVSDKDALLMTRRLAREEGILAGGSSGAAVCGVLSVARGLDSSKTVVVILPDTGRSYLSKVYNDDWMAESGFVRPSNRLVPVRSVLKKRRVPRSFCTVALKETLSGALELMAKHRLTSMPVFDHGIQVGSISAKALVKHFMPRNRRAKVGDLMEAPLPVVDIAGSISLPGSLMGERGAALVVDRDGPKDVITTEDVIDYLA